jgi:hypothetical protein
MIGDRIYEVAFIADTDGLPLEFHPSSQPSIVAVNFLKVGACN